MNDTRAGTQLRDSLCEAYDHMAPVRDAAPTEDWKVTERDAFLQLLRERRAGTLLELGAGPGRDGQFFQERDLEVTCIDLSPVMVDLCRSRGLRALVMDVADLRFPAASFEAVYALNSLLHLPKRELPPVLAQIDRVLAPGGLFYLGVYGGPEREGVWPDDTYRPRRFFSFFTDEHLQEMVSETFAVVSFRRIPLGGADDALHFQSMILEKRTPQA